MVTIDVGPLTVDGILSEDWQAFLQVNARLVLRVEDVTVLDEPSLPVLELAEALACWLEDGGAFEYRSVESDFLPLAFFSAAGGAYVASPMSSTCSRAAVPLEQLKLRVTEFIGEMRKQAVALGLRAILDSSRLLNNPSKTE